MDISLDLYKVFHEIAKTLSFSRAAESLFVSQSAVSQSLKTLESKLGFALCIRTTKKVSLTLEGDLLYQHLKQAFVLIESAEKKLSLRQNPTQGELIFAATDTLCKYFLLPIIEIMQKKFPNIKIKVHNGTSLRNLALLQEAKADFAIINLPNTPLEKHFKVQKKYPFQDVFIHFGKTTLSPNPNLKELSEKPLLLLDKLSVTRNFLDTLFAEKQLSLKPEIELQNVDILIEMAKAGLGITCVPDYCTKNIACKVIPLKEHIPHRYYAILSLDQLPVSKAGETFLAHLP